MTTATPTTTAQIVDPDLTPEVQTARAVLDEIAGSYTVLDAHYRDLKRAVNPHSDSPASEELIMEAHEHVASVGVQRARRSREQREAETGWRMARETARDDLRRACHTLKCELVRRINEGLTAAATASRELAELEDQERRFTGSWHLSGSNGPNSLRRRPRNPHVWTTGRLLAARTGCWTKTLRAYSQGRAPAVSILTPRARRATP